MAFAQRFNCTYFSSNNTEYTLEIWGDGWVGSNTAIKLGQGGCEISYDADGQGKFTRIIASKMKIPFVVENATMAAFITALRTTYQEQEVYAYLYASGTPSDTDPIWAGYILMDLGAEEDVSYPYEVDLTAVDGLALLKDRDFVVPAATSPYEVGDTWLPTNTRVAFRTYIEWLKICLDATGMATTAEGCATNYTFQTAVDWYNKDHPSSAPSLADDPLALTQCTMRPFYTVDANYIYTPKTYYDVLDAICKAWGMRCTYWNHKFYFVQITQYKTNESGSLASPDNIDTREYTSSGSSAGTQAYLGTTQFARYELDFENVSSAGTGLQKLAGTEYTYYPIVKAVKADYNSFVDMNYFDGFPMIHADVMQESTLTASTMYLTEQAIGTFTDASSLQGWYCRIPLSFQNNHTSNDTMRFSWTIVAEEVGGSGAKELRSSSGVLAWHNYSAPTAHTNFIYDIMYYESWVINPGLIVKNIFNSAVWANGVIPTDSAFDGQWSFKFQVRSLSNSSLTTMQVLAGTGGRGSTTGGASFYSLCPISTGAYVRDINYSNTYASGSGNGPLNNPYAGTFIPVLNSAVGTSSSLLTLTTSTGNDSHIIDLKDTAWGDATVPTSPSSIRVYDGSDWAYSAATGDWGLNSTSGTLSFTELLCQQVLYNQGTVTLKLNGSTALAETDKLESGYIKFVNPIGRLKDLDNRYYAMLRASFNTGSDEWEGEWFEASYGAVGYSNDQQDIPNDDSPNTGNIEGGGGMSGSMGNQAFVGNPNFSFSLTQTKTTIAANTAFTSLAIEAIVEADFTEIALLRDGDVIQVNDNVTGFNTILTLSADQAAGDTTLTVDSTTLEYDLHAGSTIIVSDFDLIAQYQNKTQGTIGDMPVTRTTLGPIAYDSTAAAAYTITGVDTSYIKILPRDFMINEDGGYEALEFKDATNTGLQVGDADQEMIATVNIPYNCTATEVYIWGSVTTKVVEVYAMDVNANGKGTAIGTGTTNGSAIALTSTASTATNYLMIIVKVTATSNRVYGGKVTLTNT